MSLRAIEMETGLNPEEQDCCGNIYKNDNNVF